MIKTATFDFDGCLDRKDVQNYAKILIDDGVEVWILTSRWDNLHINRYPEKILNKRKHNITFHSDIYDVCDRINLPYNRVIFTNMEAKYKYIATSVHLCHFDDDNVEVKHINGFTPSRAVHVGEAKTDETWKSKADSIIYGESSNNL